MAQQEFLEQLWQSDNISDNLRFFESINSAEDIIEFSRKRPNPDIKIYKRGADESEIKFIIPTINPNSEMCKNIEKLYGNYSVFFIESSGQFFNYAKAINHGIEQIVNNEKNTSYIAISNDDIILDKISITKLPNIEMNAKQAYCLTPNNGDYSGEEVILKKQGRILGIKDILFGKMSDDFIRLQIVRMLNKKKIEFPKVISGNYFIDRLIFNFDQKFQHAHDTSKIINFADFGIFNIEILKKYRFDETYINGWEDWDLSYRLNQADIKFSRLNFRFNRVGHASIGKIMSKEKEIVHSFLNGIYFYWKHLKS